MKCEFPNILAIGMFDSKKKIPETALTTAPRMVYYYELEYFFVDGGISVLNGVPYKIKKGSLLLAKPGDIRYSHLPVKCHFLHFKVTNNELTDSLKNIKSFSSVSERNKAEVFFSTVSSLFHSGNIIDNMAASSELLLLLRTLSIEHLQSSNIIFAAQKFIENNYQFNLSTEDASASVSYLDSIKNSLIWLAFIETDNGIRVRLRSRFVTINQLAEKYSGGGHACAAGATVHSKKEMKQLISEADAILKNYKSEHEGWL